MPYIIPGTLYRSNAELSTRFFEQRIIHKKKIIRSSREIEDLVDTHTSIARTTTGLMWSHAGSPCYALIFCTRVLYVPLLPKFEIWMQVVIFSGPWPKFKTR